MPPVRRPPLRGHRPVTVHSPAATKEIAGQLAENGRVLATLDDWRAIVFVLVGVIIVLVMFIIWDRFSNNKREERLARAIDKVGDAMDLMTVEIRVLRAVSSRVESNVVRD